MFSDFIFNYPLSVSLNECVCLVKYALHRVCAVHITKTLQLCCSSNILSLLFFLIYLFLCFDHTNHPSPLFAFLYVYLGDMVLLVRLNIMMSLP